MKLASAPLTRLRYAPYPTSDLRNEPIFRGGHPAARDGHDAELAMPRGPRMGPVRDNAGRRANVALRSPSPLCLGDLRPHLPLRLSAPVTSPLPPQGPWSNDFADTFLGQLRPPSYEELAPLRDPSNCILPLPTLPAVAAPVAMVRTAGPVPGLVATQLPSPAPHSVAILAPTPSAAHPAAEMDPAEHGLHMLAHFAELRLASRPASRNG